MTKNNLRLIITVIVLSSFLISAISAIFKFWAQDDNLYGFIKDFLPLYIATVAAYLTYCFQRRNNFLVSARELWKEITTTKNRLVNYTLIENPEQKDYLEVQQKLFDTIDLVRAVYINVGETRSEIGFYPFQPLHDMRKSLERCPPAGTSAENRQKVRAEFVDAWHSLRWAFLDELPRAEPSRPIVENRSRDPRR